ncbi:hypothetical protein [endosymbiont of unidentified scaly snail isolate Monju]|uniref:hypothetical protein n=1 Tax=endosymbiont of unidentified scaly snail isolate Monju TaxID=1248727 RepID=UPI0003891D1A|nr:hypothetical protein [endosymbiont of unidentified scaly snail isolate Monju]BAN68808.1 hypothetical protein EBS_0868 [endosymbiont of unidentified scaly snail isolate Monju]
MKVECIRKLFLPCLVSLVSMQVTLAAETTQWRPDAAQPPAPPQAPVAPLPPPPPVQPRFRPVPAAAWQPSRPMTPYPGQPFVNMGIPPAPPPPVVPAFARQYAWRPVSPPLIAPRPAHAWMPPGAAWARGYRPAPPPPPRYRPLPPPRPAFPMTGPVPRAPYAYPPLGYYPPPYPGVPFRGALGQPYPMSFWPGPYPPPGPALTLTPWGVMPAGNGWSDPYFTRRWPGPVYRRLGVGSRRSSWGGFLPGWMPLAGTPWGGDCFWCGS